MKELNQQLNFILELEQLKKIYRQTVVKCENNRYENSAEHSWQTALAAQILHEYVVEEVNISRVSSMLLIHDIVEIDAGDTFAFSDSAIHAQQESKELDAATRIFGLLPQAQYQKYKSMWTEFEEALTPDARFAKAVDRILPLLQNMSNEGGSWARHKVNKTQVLSRNQYLDQLAPELWHYACQQIDIAVDKGWLIDA